MDIPYSRRFLASKVTHDMLAIPLERYGGDQDRCHRTTKDNLYRAWKMVETTQTTKPSIFLGTPQDAFRGKVVHTGYRDTLSAYREGFLPVRVRTSQNEMLPEEVKDSICGGFGLTEDDWYNLSFVRLFHHAAMKLLYKKVNCHRDNLVSLTRTLLERKDLAALVQTLDIEEGRKGWFPEEDRKGWCPEEDDYSVMYAHVKEKGLTTSSESEWIDAMETSPENIEAILIGLLVLSIPQVRHLSIPNNIFLGSIKARYRSRLVASSICTVAFSTQYVNGFHKGPGSFDQLSKIHISGDGRSVSELAPLFKLPTLLTLIAYSFEGRESRNERAWKKNGFSMARDSSIRVLELYGGVIHPAVLKPMLLTCKSLEALAFDFCQFESGNCSEVSGHDLASFAAIKEALVPFIDTLKSLSLDETKVSASTDQWQPLGSLQEFTKLEYVRLDVESLYTLDPNQWKPLAQILPSCIKGIDLMSSPFMDGWWDPLDMFSLEDFVEDLTIDPRVLPNVKWLATSTDLRVTTTDQLKARGIEVHTYCYGSSSENNPWIGEQWRTRPRNSALMNLT